MGAWRVWRILAVIAIVLANSENGLTGPDPRCSRQRTLAAMLESLREARASRAEEAPEGETSIAAPGRGGRGPAVPSMAMITRDGLGELIRHFREGRLVPGSSPVTGGHTAAALNRAFGEARSSPILDTITMSGLRLLNGVPIVVPLPGGARARVFIYEVQISSSRGRMRKTFLSETELRLATDGRSLLGVPAVEGTEYSSAIEKLLSDGWRTGMELLENPDVRQAVVENDGRLEFSLNVGGRIVPMIGMLSHNSQHALSTQASGSVGGGGQGQLEFASLYPGGRGGMH